VLQVVFCRSKKLKGTLGQLPRYQVWSHGTMEDPIFTNGNVKNVPQMWKA